MLKYHKDIECCIASPATRPMCVSMRWSYSLCLRVYFLVSSILCCVRMECKRFWKHCNAQKYFRSKTNKIPCPMKEENRWLLHCEISWWHHVCIIKPRLSVFLPKFIPWPSLLSLSSRRHHRWFYLRFGFFYPSFFSSMQFFRSLFDYYFFRHFHTFYLCILNFFFFRFLFPTEAFLHTNQANIHHHESLYCRMKLINESPATNFLGCAHSFQLLMWWNKIKMKYGNEATWSFTPHTYKFPSVCTV